MVKMKQKDLDKKINHMLDSEFLQDEELNKLNNAINDWMKTLDDIFGDNDGEPLDEDGIKFVTDLIPSSSNGSPSLSPKISSSVFIQSFIALFSLFNSSSCKNSLSNI